MQEYQTISPGFAAKLAALPKDLTGCNLEPLYDLARTHDDDHQYRVEYGALRELEKAWTPNLANLGDEYNGPLGENGKALLINVSKWRDAKRAQLKRQLIACFAQSPFSLALVEDLNSLSIGSTCPN